MQPRSLARSLSKYRPVGSRKRTLASSMIGLDLEVGDGTTSRACHALLEVPPEIRLYRDDTRDDPGSPHVRHVGANCRRSPRHRELPVAGVMLSLRSPCLETDEWLQLASKCLMTTRCRTARKDSTRLCRRQPVTLCGSFLGRSVVCFCRRGLSRRRPPLVPRNGCGCNAIKRQSGRLASTRIAWVGTKAGKPPSLLPRDDP